MSSNIATPLKFEYKILFGYFKKSTFLISLNLHFGINYLCKTLLAI